MRTLSCVLWFSIQCCLASAQKLHIDAPVKFLALGDSYTIGQSVKENERWPVQLINALRLRAFVADDAKIIARTGWQTGDVIAAIDREQLNNDYSLVSLLIGVNDFYRNGTGDVYAREFEDLLKTSIRLAKGHPSNVFVVSIPDYGYTPFGKGDQPRITAGINSFNEISKQIASDYAVPFIDIVEISRGGLSRPDLVAGDGLHPSAKQYSLWVDLIIKEAVLNRSENPVDPVDTLITNVGEDEISLSVYPNPFNDYISIDRSSDGNGDINFSLVDVMGRTIHQEQSTQTQSTITFKTDMLPAGIYAYRISVHGKLYSGKVLKR